MHGPVAKRGPWAQEEVKKHNGSVSQQRLENEVARRQTSPRPGDGEIGEPIENSVTDGYKQVTNHWNVQLRRKTNRAERRSGQKAKRCITNTKNEDGVSAIVAERRLNQ